MKRIIYLLLLVIPISYSFSQVNQNITQRLDSIVKKYVDSSEFMGSVLIAKNSEVLLKKGFGFADIENKIPNTPSTNFYLASVSKLFTISAIIDLKNKGLLKLDDTLTKYVPDYPNGNRITVKQLWRCSCR
jgi:CubicO group peptidase (beta-lactamase class C family)